MFRSSIMLSQLPSRSQPQQPKQQAQLQASLVFGIILISFATTTCVVLSLLVLFGKEQMHFAADESTMTMPMTDGAAGLRGGSREEMLSSALVVNKEALRQQYPPTIWTTRKQLDEQTIAQIRSKLTKKQRSKAKSLCARFLYSSLHRAVEVQHGNQAFVATGDIDDMWLRDSAVQIGIYLNRPHDKFLRLIIEGAIRRNAFNIIQDPYANAYSRYWRNPAELKLRDQVIGRGGWVSTRNYELDSGAYFLQQLYDFYVSVNVYEPELLLKESMIVEAVMLMIDTWIVEQHHEEKSPYQYFELPREGKGPPSVYTGMTWAGFRPSDDPCMYGYLVPANIHAAAALERVLVMNQHVWHVNEIQEKASKLLQDITDGINKHGIVERDGVRMYAYEVDGQGGVLADFDDANVPSLLSIPVLGWSGYDKEVYAATRKRLLSPKNSHWFEGKVLKGIGSPHTPSQMVWSMAMTIQALTETENVVETFAFQIDQSLRAACNDAMHESVHVTRGCENFTRPWFEW